MLHPKLTTLRYIDDLQFKLGSTETEHMKMAYHGDVKPKCRKIVVFAVESLA